MVIHAYPGDWPDVRNINIYLHSLFWMSRSQEKIRGCKSTRIRELDKPSNPFISAIFEISPPLQLEIISNNNLQLKRKSSSQHVSALSSAAVFLDRASSLLYCFLSLFSFPTFLLIPPSSVDIFPTNTHMQHQKNVQNDLASFSSYVTA